MTDEYYVSPTQVAPAVPQVVPAVAAAAAPGVMQRVQNMVAGHPVIVSIIIVVLLIIVIWMYYNYHGMFGFGGGGCRQSKQKMRGSRGVHESQTNAEEEAFTDEDQKDVETFINTINNS